MSQSSKLSTPEDFLPKYPNIENFSELILNPYSTDFYESIYHKKEFYEKRLAPTEGRPAGVGEPLRHQEIISRFLSSQTLYDSLLLFHEMGTGKTGASVAVAELLKSELLRDDNELIKGGEGRQIGGALVLLRGKTLIDNYIQELVFTNTKGEYIPEGYEDLPSREIKYRRIKKKVAEFYDFDTFEVFAKNLNKKSDREVVAEYSNRLIVIDEVHNIRLSTDEINIYTSIHRFLHLVKNCKILLMTATPMKDRPQEIATILNLILPLDSQMPVGESFIKEFMNKSSREDLYTVRTEKIPILKKYFKGRISYLKSSRSRVAKQFIGKKIGDLQRLIIDDLEMDVFQSEVYGEAYRRDTMSEEEKGIYSNSRQASLFSFPDRTWGSAGWGTNIIESKISEEKKIYSLAPKFKNYLYQRGKTNEDILHQIGRCSVKYKNAIKTILDSKVADRLSFVYCDFVAGSGAILFSKLLELVGFRRYMGDEGINELAPALRYSIITNQTATPSQTRSILNTFNDPRNLGGDYLSVIVGSRVIGEGFSLKNIQDIHILTPHWNYSETDQAVARGIRLFGHRDLENKGRLPLIKIYQYAAITALGGALGGRLKNSIDYKMYLISEDKDISIKSIERIVKESSFDCALNYNRNRVYNEDFARICDYQRCDYQCMGQQAVDIPANALDLSTYNLFYDRESMGQTIDTIKTYFSKKNLYKLEELLDLSPNNKFLLLKSLDRIIQDRIPIINNHSQLCYLKNYGDIYYTDISVDTDSSPSQPYYIDNPVFFELKSLDELVYKYELVKLPTLIKRLETTSATADYEKIFNNLTPLTVELFIEASIVGLRQGAPQNEMLRTWILSRYKSYIRGAPPKTIYSTYLATTSDIPQIKKIRCLEEGKEKWDYCDIPLGAVEISAPKIEKLGELGYYGVYENKTDKFLIVDVSDPTKVKGGAAKGKETDTRTKSRGRVCKTILKRDLIVVCVKLQIEPLDQKTGESLVDRAIGKLTSADIKQVRQQISHKLTEGEIDKLTQRQLKIGYYFLNLVKTNEMCSIIKKWMEDNDKLETK